MGKISLDGPKSTLLRRAPVHCLALLHGSTASSTTCAYAVVLAHLGYGRRQLWGFLKYAKAEHNLAGATYFCRVNGNDDDLRRIIL